MTSGSRGTEPGGRYGTGTVAGEHRQRVGDRAPGDDPGPVRSPAPCGTWPSPFSAAAVAAGKISRSGLHIDGAGIYWLESRPDEGGRQVLVRSSAHGGPADVSPPDRSIRSRLHEYGGGAATVVDGNLYFVDQSDQALYRWELESGAGAAPTRLTAAAPADGSLRYADGRLSADGDWFVCVEERHGPRGVGHGIVAVPADGSQATVPVLEGRDFYAAPRPSPDGAHLAWLTWDHPQMPWDGCELWIGRWAGDDGEPRITESRRIAGGSDISIGQPLWCGDGSLCYLSDEAGWWQPHRLTAVDDARSVPSVLVSAQAEFHGPDWVLGQATMAELPDGALACRMHVDGADRVVRIPAPMGSGPDEADGEADGEVELEVIPQPCVAISGVCVDDKGGVVVLGATTTVGPSVYAMAPAAPSGAPGATQGRSRASWEQPQLLSAGSTLPVPPGDIAVAEAVVAMTPDGPVHSLLYPPSSSSFEVPAGTPPPVVVMCHGGPTAANDRGFDPLVQYFTSRGLAVLAVNYRGSVGYGRAYRQRLRGLWGQADVDDCVWAAVSLADEGRVDGGRMVIRGTSAGGLTALGALIRSDRFAGAATWYGVTDLEALAAETHDFEARYIDTLVGPLPDAVATYRDRSPIHHADAVSGAVLLLQGLDDPVVPADQAVRFAEALRAHGVDCRYQAFAGESHGFRQADTLRTAIQAELDFYAAILGFEPADDGAGSGRDG
jgi:dipeptidyl aminopeptidase/acylaminoacyl peptidase